MATLVRQTVQEADLAEPMFLRIGWLDESEGPDGMVSSETRAYGEKRGSEEDPVQAEAHLAVFVAPRLVVCEPELAG
jgi:hypothetical protein